MNCKLVTLSLQGRLKVKSLMQMSDEELESIEVTRTLISRILGQTHEPCEKVYSALLVCLKFLLRRAAQITQKWKEPITDHQLCQDLVKLLQHIRDTPVLPQERAVIPANYRIAVSCIKYLARSVC